MERGVCGRTALALAAASLVTAPAVAQDETTGILAGLGVVAAAGKTSLGNGAGAIEAGMLSADAFEQAADVIRSAVQKLGSSRPVIILAGDEQVDILAPQQIDDLLKDIGDQVEKQCKLRLPKPKESTQELFPGTEVKAADVVGVFTTDVSIGGITLTASDRRIVNALLMQNRQVPPAVLNGEWQSWQTVAGGGQQSSIKLATMTTINEPVGLPARSTVATAFNTFDTKVRSSRKDCPTPAGQSALEVADALKKNLLDTSKGVSPLSRAIQINAAGENPLLLRIGIEQIGGTSIARSGFLYTIGLLNAATVSAGLYVSFRIVDPAADHGALRVVGEIRCLTPQTNIKKVRERLGRKVEVKEATTCGYRAVTTSTTSPKPAS